MTDKQKLSRELRGVEILAQQDQAHINDDMIFNVAKQVGLSLFSMKRAWLNNQTSFDGRTNQRFIDGKHTNTIDQKVQNSVWQKKYRSVSTRKFTAEEAAKIINKVMDSKQPVGKILYKNNVSHNQYYRWIKEINTLGTIYGKKVVSPKYKVEDIMTAINYNKNPERYLNLSDVMHARLQRRVNVIKNFVKYIKENK
jgi:hypothetical protein